MLIMKSHRATWLLVSSLVVLYGTGLSDAAVVSDGCGASDSESGDCARPRQARETQDIFFVEHGCEEKDKFAVIVHGWKENCKTEWIQDMIYNLTLHRGGCIVCMDYGKYSLNDDYFGRLVPKFEIVVEALLNRLELMEKDGFDPANGFMFGFSFGSQSAIEAGRRFGFHKMGRIDACDPAGPGFDSDRNFSSLDPKLAAKNVQCIHTSNDKGTFRRDCHQDWDMGNCGNSQPASGPYPKGSHGLCPYFYNSAFTHEFRAIPKPKECTSFRAATHIPTDFRMGYLSDANSTIIGDFYARTTKHYPYNEIPNEV
uniref:Putative triacylglycerol lipase n=1 Tax=Psorophora albipes TaxID=869069 RepID=T1DIE1_9DIPT